MERIKEPCRWRLVSRDDATDPDDRPLFDREYLALCCYPPCGGRLANVRHSADWEEAPMPTTWVKAHIEEAVQEAERLGRELTATEIDTLAQAARPTDPWDAAYFSVSPPSTGQRNPDKYLREGNPYELPCTIECPLCHRWNRLNVPPRDLPLHQPRKRHPRP